MRDQKGFDLTSPQPSVLNSLQSLHNFRAGQGGHDFSETSNDTVNQMNNYTFFHLLWLLFSPSTFLACIQTNEDKAGSKASFSE